jgi:hypothetical protein
MRLKDCTDPTPHATWICRTPTSSDSNSGSPPSKSISRTSLLFTRKTIASLRKPGKRHERSGHELRYSILGEAGVYFNSAAVTIGHRVDHLIQNRAILNGAPSQDAFSHETDLLENPM